jgi:hypothetical protein
MNDADSLVRIFNFSDEGVKAFRVSEEEHRESLLQDLGQVLVFTGPRGSGKTLSMCFWAVVFMVEGHKVWSNFPISFDFYWPGGQKVHYQSTPIDMATIYEFDKELNAGVVCLDEISLWCSARRSMAVANRLLNNFLVMTRKRKLTFMFSAQNFQWLDNQLRFQTDLLFKCADMSHWNKTLKAGEVINWTIQDMSGFYSGLPAYEGIVEGRNEFKYQLWGRPFWPFFNSWQEFDVTEAARSVVEIARPPLIIDRRTEAQRSREKTIYEGLTALRDSGESRFSSEQITEYMESLGITIDSRQLGRYMKGTGFTYRQTRKGNFYELNEGNE